MSLDFKIAVCDDEAYFWDRIKELLQKYFIFRRSWQIFHLSGHIRAFWST